MAAITTVQVANFLNTLLIDSATFTDPTGNRMLRLMTADGSDATAGTSVTGGSYAPIAVTFGTTATRAITNTSAPSFTGMPAATVTGVEIWDSAGTPVRLCWGPLTASKTVSAGDTLSFAASAITLTMG